MIERQPNKRFIRWTARLLVIVMVMGLFVLPGGKQVYAAAADGVWSSSSNYSFVMHSQDGKLYVNQKAVDLSWKRDYSVSATGYFFSRSQSILGNLNDILKVSYGSYNSSYSGNVPHAFLIDFDKLWELYSTMEYRQSGMNVGVWNNSNVDVFGLPTPRDVYSFETKSLALVVNADTGTVVDLLSDVNPYYTQNGLPKFVKETSSPEPVTDIPGVPNNIIADKTATSIRLQWPHINQAVQYEIEENGVNKGPYYGESYTAGGLQPDTLHTYRVRAVNKFGQSDWSSPVQVRTLLQQPVLNVEPSEGANIVSWAAVDHATSYSIQIDNASPVDLGNVLNYKHEALEANSTHTYQLKAYSGDNESQWSKVVTQKTVPERAGGLKITDTTFNKLSVSWNAVAGATGYDLEVDGVITAVTGTSYNKTGLAANTEHSFRVRSKNSGGAGSWSDPLTAFTSLSTPALQASSTQNSIALVWTAIDGASSYEIEADGAVVGTVTDSAFVQSGLLPGTAHKYRVRAVNDTNTSAWTALLTQSTIPADVTGLNISTVTNAAIGVKWTAVTGATGYDLEIDGTTVAVTGTSYTKSGLAANSEHTFRIRSKNAAGTGSWSSPVSGTTQLNTPVLKAASTDTAVTLTWAEIADAAKYEVEADGVVVGTVTDPTYVHANLVPGTAHKYRIRALTDTNTSAWTALLTQSTIPADVTGLSISTVTNAAIGVKWTAVTGATGYDLEIDGTTVAVTGTSYTKSGLAANSEHTFRIRSKNAAGTGSWSSPVSGTTQLNTPVLKAASTDTAVTLTWAKIADAAKYEVEADGVVVGTVTDPAYVHANLVPGTAHKYRIRALTDTNTSAWTALLTQSTIPADVTGLNISTVTNAAIGVKWTAVTGATGYDLEIDGTAVSLTATSYTKSGLAANSEHTFRIRSKNAAGVGSWSSPVSGTTQLNTPVLKAASTDTAVTLTWAEIADGVKYEVEADGVVVGTVTDPTYVHANLVPGTAHKYRIRALTDTNTSAWAALLTQSTIPADVTGLNISTVTNAAIGVKWNAVTGATGYDLEIDGTAVSLTATSYTKSGLAANSEHTFRIRAKNAAGTGNWGSLISGLTLLNTPVVKGTVTNSSVSLSWDAVPGATAYEIEADGAVVATVNDNIYIHENLLPLTLHKYRVRALTSTNSSLWSAVSSFKTLN
ncbi:fibronectin type III domain-containing protein [Paenibacillus sp. JX-17]|uniref:Fibronectin type III domain-containing protein n=1 Tax=Paenibacillus lacisoli TaxID=3064525 RepID=A0ABT9CGI5_9BACL|nr:fibronectin type III domain-containing protein [Paenibacillus sp. JX-17]MDO7906791.1 fibronectin type III domain-containing protein [Paenibacillus sp. JX-17]